MVCKSKVIVKYKGKVIENIIDLTTIDPNTRRISYADGGFESPVAPTIHLIYIDSNGKQQTISDSCWEFEFTMTE